MNYELEMKCLILDRDHGLAIYSLGVDSISVELKGKRGWAILQNGKRELLKKLLFFSKTIGSGSIFFPVMKKEI